MDNKSISTDTTIIEKTSSPLQDYELEISDKKGFFANLFDKLKTNKQQKLLDSGNKVKTTQRSISSLWGIGDLRATLFSSFDTIRQAISKRFSSESPKNTLTVEIISENTQNKQLEENRINDTAPKTQTTIITPIIPNTKPKTIINNSPKIEVATIDTSAIDKKAENIKNTSTSDKIKLSKQVENSKSDSLGERE